MRPAEAYAHACSIGHKDGHKTKRPKPHRARPAKLPPSNTVDGWVVRNVKIYDLDNNLVYKGDVDIEPTLDRIANGIRDSHRNDGSTFGNFERRLPSKPRGYYTEYVLRTPGLSGVGPQRVIWAATTRCITRPITTSRLSA